MLHGTEANSGRRHGPTKGSGRRSFGRLRKLPSGRWQAAYTGPDTVVYRASTTFDDEDAARGWLKGERRLIDAETWTPPPARITKRERTTQTFREYAETWLATRRTRTGEPLKPRTRTEYRRYLDRHILPALGDVPLHSLTADVVDNWHEGMDANTPTERAHCYQLVRAICTTATDKKLMPANPASIAGAGKVNRARRIRPAELDELAIIVQAMPERFRAAVLLGSWCAMRYGEVAELRRRDVALDRGIISVRRGVTWPAGVATVGTPKSLAGNRDIHIPPHLLPIIRDHLERHTGPGGDALLFPAASGGHLHPRTFGKRFDKARAAAGRPDLTFHALRHTGAVLAAQTGATLAELMARLGHSTPGAALLYQHAAADRDRAIAAELSKRFEGGRK